MKIFNKKGDRFEVIGPPDKDGTIPTVRYDADGTPHLGDIKPLRDGVIPEGRELVAVLSEVPVIITEDRPTNSSGTSLGYSRSYADGWDRMFRNNPPDDDLIN